MRRLPGATTCSGRMSSVSSAVSVGSGLSGMAWVALEAGEPDNAERLLDEASGVLRGAAPWFSALGLYVGANLAVRRGEPDAAIALVRQSLALIRELHDRFALGYALVPLAAAAL